MRNEYYKFIQENGISDILVSILDFSYTHKLKLLRVLKEKFNIDAINFALTNYNIYYIERKRVDLQKLHNVLIYYAKQFKEKN